MNKELSLIRHNQRFTVTVLTDVSAALAVYTLVWHDTPSESELFPVHQESSLLAKPNDFIGEHRTPGQDCAGAQFGHGSSLFACGEMPFSR